MATHELLSTESGNAVVTALDHGLSLGSVDGFHDPAETLQNVLDGDPDAVLVGPHFARRHSAMLSDSNTDIVVTADIVSGSRRPGFDDGEDIWTPSFGTDLLLELDPVGVKTVLVFGRDDRQMFLQNLAYIAEMAEELRDTGVPLVVEPVMWGARIPEHLETNAEYVAKACRMAWEYGADILKVPYTGDVETFAPIVENSPVPVMILGGPASGTTPELLADVEGAVSAGARGIMIGRSIWKSENPTETISALNEVVHENASAENVW